MKKITDILFSSKTTFILLVLFGIAMGVATFIEDKFDTYTSKMLVYNAKWFEFLLLLLAINFYGHIKRYNMFSKQKAAGFVFHFAFVLLIIGAAVTRYIGFEGSMPIREGETSNTIYSSESFFRVMANESSYEMPFHYSPLVTPSFDFKLEIKDKGELQVKYSNYIQNAVEQMQENVEGGVNSIELSFMGNKGREAIFVENGEIKNLWKISISYNKPNNNGISVLDQDGQLKLISSRQLTRTSMADMQTDTIYKDSIAEFKENCVYTVDGAMFIFVKSYKKAKRVWTPGPEGTDNPDALIVDVTLDNKTKQVAVIGGTDYYGNFKDEDIFGTTVKFAYGQKPIELPFSLFLNDFVLDRYAGSMSPSSYESTVTLIDNNKNIKEEHKIFMNNVLDYGGYRFFQSGFDPDEKGTILSVNHDFWGTWISYIGYILLSLGFMLTFVNPNSRFVALRKSIQKIREERKASLLTIALIFGFVGIGFSQTNNQKVVSEEQADKFGHLIVQNFEGRFEPVHSLAIDVMHKISRKDYFKIEGLGKLTDMQVFLDMMLNPEYWKQQKILYVREQSVRDAIGVTENLAAFNDFFDQKGNYKLAAQSETAFQKKPTEQNTFDKEILKVNERLEVCMGVFQGIMLKIFPDAGSVNNKWVTWNDSAAFMPLGGVLKVINDDLQLQSFNYHNILNEYFIQVINGNNSGDYSKADKIIGYIISIQKQGTPEEILPSESKIEMEVFYNKSNMFVFLRNFYAACSMILLVLAFIENLRIKRSKLVGTLLNVFTVILGLAFLYHTFGIGLRWYLTGHAPWSNGYETLVFVAWGGLLAGFSFARNSKITLASTALMAFFILMTAGHSMYDPQLTNLVPVLKSYWLIIHVATLTISYGFLGSGFILGLINMLLYWFKSKNNHKRLHLTIKELTYISEMNLSIGLALATIGTFLGGVWANESWGRYWGWDAKETWALVIVVAYAVVLHLRLIPKLKGAFTFNVASIIAFGSVIMTFVGVNYYLTKGMHSYGAGDTPVFPLWAWGIIFSVILLVVGAWFRENRFKNEE